jgi:hypothetical protein
MKDEVNIETQLCNSTWKRREVKWKNGLGALGERISKRKLKKIFIYTKVLFDICSS